MREYILSIDASLSSTGWAVIEKKSKDVIDLSKICTTNKIDEDERIFIIASGLIEQVEKYSITEVSMEDQHMHKNAKTAMQLSRLRGGITMALMLNGAKVKYKQPSAIRRVFMGKGNASKEEVAQAIVDMYPDNIFIKNLGPFSDKPNKKKNSDMYDAVGIGVAYLIDEETTSQQLTA